MTEEITSKSISIMIDSDVEKRIRIKQAQLIQEQNKTISFSSVVNEALRGNVKI